MYQHPPSAMQPTISVHHTTARASHRAHASCCQAGPFRSQYLTSPTSSPAAEPGITITMYATTVEIPPYARMHRRKRVYSETHENSPRNALRASRLECPRGGDRGGI